MLILPVVVRVSPDFRSKEFRAPIDVLGAGTSVEPTPVRVGKGIRFLLCLRSLVGGNYRCWRSRRRGRCESRCCRCRACWRRRHVHGSGRQRRRIRLWRSLPILWRRGRLCRLNDWSRLFCRLAPNELRFQLFDALLHGGKLLKDLLVLPHLWISARLRGHSTTSVLREAGYRRTASTRIARQTAFSTEIGSTSESSPYFEPQKSRAQKVGPSHS